MSYEILVGVIGFIVSMIAVVTPIVKLNVNISKLNTTIEMFQQDTEDKYDNLDKRVTKHGEQIDELEKVSVNHEVRITAIERKRQPK